MNSRLRRTQIRSRIRIRVRSHISEEFKGLSNLPNEPVIEEGLDVAFRRYRTYGERTSVFNLCAVLEERLEAWSGGYFVPADATGWQRVIIASHAAKDVLLVRIHLNYTPIEVCHGFKCEQEPFFSYNSRAVIADRESGFWWVAYTGRVLRICAAMLMAV